MFTAGQSHPLIHIQDETVENLGLMFHILLPTFQEWVMGSEYKFWLVNLILASCVLTFRSSYRDKNEDVVHIFGCATLVAYAKRQ